MKENFIVEILLINLGGIIPLYYIRDDGGYIKIFYSYKEAEIFVYEFITNGLYNREYFYKINKLYTKI